VSLRIDTSGGTVEIACVSAVRSAGWPTPSGTGPASRDSGYCASRWVGSTPRPSVTCVLTEVQLAALTEALSIVVYPRTGEVYETASATWLPVSIGAVSVTRSGQLYTATVEVAQ